MNSEHSGDEGGSSLAVTATLPRDDWHRGWLISKAFMGYHYQHPGFDHEKRGDDRCGHANTADEARTAIDDYLADQA